MENWFSVILGEQCPNCEISWRLKRKIIKYKCTITYAIAPPQPSSATGKGRRNRQGQVAKESENYLEIPSAILNPA